MGPNVMRSTRSATSSRGMSLYSIDEIGVDTTKRSRIKVWCTVKKQKTQCVSYLRTFEGDGRMTRHMSIVLCSRADGAYCYP
eukprot:2611899-Ditylum_brightwellii.AAC.1